MLEFFLSLAHSEVMETGSSSSSLTRLCAGITSHAVLVIIFLTCVTVEMVLEGADQGFWGSSRWRGLAYQNGGFWRGLLDNWQPNYYAQPLVMFASYGFLHGGFLHLLVNMITLVSFGRLVTERVGQLRFAIIYALSLLGGATGFAILSTAVQPMVGASGALFGLLGALTGLEYAARRLAREGIGPVLRVIGLLIVLNIIMYWAMDGSLAWEAHLGGFLTGWVAGWWVRERDHHA